jgi:hypothetical protein
MWILSILPNWVIHAFLFAGLAGTIAGFVLGMIPVIKQYIIPIRIISLVILTFAIFLEGGLSDNQAWELRVKEMEAKVAKAEAISAKENTKLLEKVVTKTQYVKGKTEYITRYLDREVVKNSEVIKFIEQCPAIPQAILKSHNESATIRKESK